MCSSFKNILAEYWIFKTKENVYNNNNNNYNNYLFDRLGKVPLQAIKYTFQTRIPRMLWQTERLNNPNL